MWYFYSNLMFFIGYINAFIILQNISLHFYVISQQNEYLIIIFTSHKNHNYY